MATRDASEGRQSSLERAGRCEPLLCRRSASLLALFRRRLPLEMSGEDAYAVLGLVETAADSEV